MQLQQSCVDGHSLVTHSANRTHISMTLADPNFEDTPGEELSVVFNPARAAQLFARSGHSFEEIAALAKERKQLPRFPLAISISATAKLAKQEVRSANVVVRLPGSDPALKNEYVVLSAHIDHIGIGEPINGERIYNGAMDNASGSAVVLDVASSLKKSGETFKRSLLFVFVAGEEKGLLGSRYFTAHPTVDPKAMVADINIDMFLPIVPLKLLTVWGLAESDLGDEVRHVAEAQGIRVQADPEPQRNVFIRSDQYNVIRHGVPARMMSVAPDLSSPQQVQLFRDWLTHRYHAPSDDLEQPVDLSAAAKYEEVIRELMTDVANGSHRPQWKPESFFRRYSESPSQY
jgi:Zn-dependent M28 family amino/carboxypeptidase